MRLTKPQPINVLPRLRKFHRPTLRRSIDYNMAETRAVLFSPSMSQTRLYSEMSSLLRSHSQQASLVGGKDPLYAAPPKQNV